MQLEIDKCCGKRYDKASNMISKKYGVAQKIKKIQPKTHYMDSYANLNSIFWKVCYRKK